MGRKKSNTVEYFPHFADQGRTLFILKSRFNNNGYAFWFQLLEVLCLEEGHFYDFRDEGSWQYLLSITGVEEKTGRAILDLLANLGKIDAFLYQKNIIWCENLVRNLENVYKKRGRDLPEKPCLFNDNNDTAPDTIISVTENTEPVTEIPQSRVEESRVKQSRGKTAAASGKKQKDDFEEYREQLRERYPDLNYDGELEKFNLYWYEGKRKPPKNKKLALLNWMNKARQISAESDALAAARVASARGHERLKGDGNGAHRRGSTKLPASYSEPPSDPELEASLETD